MLSQLIYQFTHLYLAQSIRKYSSYNSFMCGGIEYQGDKVFFPNPEARLPVRTRDGGITWVPWGERRQSVTLPSQVRSICCC
jgi:hypothetical protein